MKKLSSLLFLALLPLLASAYDAEVDGIYYNLITKAKQAIVTSGDNKYTGSVTIPETVTHEGVTYSVTEIGEDAFISCTSLTSVTIPNSVTAIGNHAFNTCSALTSVKIGNSVTTIGEYVFRKCSSLTSVTIPNSVTEIGRRCFLNSGLKSVTIGNSVTLIGAEAFEGCNLTSVHITDVAAWCKINFSNSSISSNPLASAKHLFMDGKEIKDLVIPNDVTEIGELAFYNCSSLTSVTIPNSVTEIGSHAFYGCSSLAKVYITDVATWCKINFTNTYSNPLYYAKHLYLNVKEITDLVIPNSVTSIISAFQGCTGLTSVTIPNSVTEIISAFQGCTGLTSVTIPNSVTEIAGAFQGCTGLKSVVIPNSVTAIGGSTFYGCSGLKEVIIGSGVKSIGKTAFANCTELTDVHCLAENVPSTNSTAFDGSYIEYVNLYVPEASVDTYKAATPWDGFKSVTSIDIIDPETPDDTDPETPKCATPTIAFANGELQFSCETEDVEYVYNVTPPSAKAGSGSKVSLSTTYKITVYATKSGYEDSDVATKEINVSGMVGIRGDVNSDGTVSMPDAMFIVNKILNGKFPDE